MKAIVEKKIAGEDLMSKETLKAQAQGRIGEIDFDIEIENR